MFLRKLQSLTGDPVWLKLEPFSLVLLFIFLGDAILSFWIPNFLQDALGSPFKMGLIVSFSSVVGLLADILFPQIFKNLSVKKLLLLSILTSFVFIASLFAGVVFPVLMMLALSMAVWGIFYEFVHFSQSQFVADSMPSELKSFGWAIFGIFRNLAYFLGPLLAGYLLLFSNELLLFSVFVFTLISLLLFYFSFRSKERESHEKVARISVLRELLYWKILSAKVWPVILLSLFVGFIDAAFWTTGAVWTKNLSSENAFGSFLLPAYQLPSLFMGFVLARWKIYKGKKRLSEKFLLMAGIFLMLLYFDFPVLVYVFIVFLSSIYLALSVPLVEAVYSDIIARMGIERKHMVGLSASTVSIAYIISPTLAGYLASGLGEKSTFVLLGFGAVITAAFLLFVTPKKIRLPEKEIKSWK